MAQFRTAKSGAGANYTFLRHIGKGSFGTVALLRDRRDGQCYIMKRVSYTDDEATSKHEREALTEVRAGAR